MIELHIGLAIIPGVPARPPQTFTNCDPPKRVSAFSWNSIGLRCILIFSFLCNPLLQGKAADFFDDFSAGVASWVSSPGWVLVEQASGSYVFRGDSAGDTFSQNGYFTLGDSWRLEVDVRFRRYYADGNKRALAAFALFPALNSGVQFEANLGSRTNESTQVDVQWYNPPNGTWHNVLQSDWTPNIGSKFRMHLTRVAGSDRLTFKVTSTNGFFYRTESAPIPRERLDQLRVFGFRVNSSQVEFGNLRAISPYVPPVPPVITAQPESQTVTTGATVTFRVAATGPGTLSYQWFKGRARITGATNSSYTLQRALPAYAGAYSVIVDNLETAVTSSPAVLKVIDAHIRLAAASRTNGLDSEGLALELVVPSEVNYVLQHTLDFATWTNLASSVGIGSPIEFKHAEATNHTRGFYRLWLP